MPTKPTILAVMQLPPPVHGMTTINQHVAQSPLLRDAFALHVYPLHFARDTADLGRLRLGKFFYLCKTLLCLAVRLRRLQPQAVYFTLTPAGKTFYRDLCYLALFRWCRCRTILHLHGQGIRARARTWWGRFWNRWALQGRYLILPSPRLYPDVESAATETQVRYLPNGIPEQCSATEWSRIHAQRAQHELPHILFLSAMTEAKGVFVLLAALGWLKAKGCRFTVTFAGKAVDHVLLRRFHQQIANEALGDVVQYIGHCYAETKHRLLCTADIFVHPTLNDAFPLVVLEAMQYGLPIVAAADGGIPTMLGEGQAGYLFPRGDSVQLGLHLKTLLQSPALRQQMGERSRAAFMRHYTLPIFEEQMRNTLLEMIQSSTGVSI